MGQSTWRTQADKPPRRAANCDLSPSHSCARAEDVSVQTTFVPSGSLRVHFQVEGEGARPCAPAWLYRKYGGLVRSWLCRHLVKTDYRLILIGSRDRLPPSSSCRSRTARCGRAAQSPQTSTGQFGRATSDEYKRSLDRPSLSPATGHSSIPDMVLGKAVLFGPLQHARRTALTEFPGTGVW